MELSIQSTNIQTRQAARSTVVNYVKNYNLKKKLVKILELYCAQLGYEHEFGRLSAAESLKLLITNIGAGTVDNQASFIFISLAPHLVNDESSSCRKSISKTCSRITYIIFTEWRNDESDIQLRQYSKYRNKLLFSIIF